MAVLAKLNILIDRNRESRRLPWNIAGNHDRGAELTQRAREGEQRAAEYPATCQGQCNGEKNAPLACPERPCESVATRRIVVLPGCRP